MKKILLIGGDDALMNDLLEYGERIGGYKVERFSGACPLVTVEHHLVIMDPLSPELSPIETIKSIARLTPMPALAMLITKEDAGKRVQEACFQYARAKGILNSTKLKYPVFLGDVQTLINRPQHSVNSSQPKKHIQMNIEILRTAIEQCEFEVHFQPKIALKAGHIIGAEALVRWRHPQHGMVPPDAFVPLIEEFGLMNDMTWLVLEKSLAQAAEWRRLGYDFKVAVNFSASTFCSPSVADMVLSMIRDARLDPDCLSIELTESAMVQNLDVLLESVLDLYRQGVEISIDDYGTGYSSLQQVSVVPASEIKIDQSFVRDMLDNPVDQLIVRNTIRMAHSLGMRSLAEGVESKRHALALARSGCDEAQGYFFSRPIDQNAFLAYAGNNPSREISRYFNINKV